MLKSWNQNAEAAISKGNKVLFSVSGMVPLGLILQMPSTWKYLLTHPSPDISSTSPSRFTVEHKRAWTHSASTQLLPDRRFLLRILADIA